MPGTSGKKAAEAALPPLFARPSSPGGCPVWPRSTPRRTTSPQSAAGPPCPGPPVSPGCRRPKAWSRRLGAARGRFCASARDSGTRKAAFSGRILRRGSACAPSRCWSARRASLCLSSRATPARTRFVPGATAGRSPLRILLFCRAPHPRAPLGASREAPEGCCLLGERFESLPRGGPQNCGRCFLRVTWTGIRNTRGSRETGSEACTSAFPFD